VTWLFSQARKFALKAHGDQMYGKYPYTYHLNDVVTILESHGYHGRERVVAWLHDVLEDTPTEFKDVWEAFGIDIARACDFCTDVSGKKNRRERKQATYKKQRVAVAWRPTWLAMAIRTKVADRISNVKNSQFNDGLWRMYQREALAFKGTLYVPGMCDDLWATLELWQEGERCNDQRKR
jgi:(p)ppGpp synthase/HD superfamily hydrolase